MASLTELAIRFGCDKHYSHSYCPVYTDLFRDRTVNKLLEIGIGFEQLMKPFVPFYIHGASLRMWAEYFPEAEIFSCDIREETLINEGRIHSMQCDQGERGDLITLAELWGPWDVIIDDGSHQTLHQINTALTLLPYLNSPGAYVIEDVQEPDLVFHALAPYAISKKDSAIDVFTFGKRPDDNLVVVTR